MTSKEMFDKLNLKVERSEYDLLYLADDQEHDITLDTNGEFYIDSTFSCTHATIREVMAMAKWLEENGFTWENVEDKIQEMTINKEK